MALRCGVAVAACVAAMAPPASAGWLAPLPLSAPDRPALFPAVALGADGRLVAAWSRSDGTHFRIEAALRPPGGTLEAPQIVSEAGVDAAPVQVALDAQGNAVLMWIRGQSYQWATRAAGAGAFGDLHTVPLPAGERASSFRLAVAPTGQAAATILTLEDATMTDNHSRVRAMTREPGGDFELSAVLDEGLDNGDDVYSFGPVDMDADAQGGFYATWTRSHSLSATHSTSDVRVAVRPAGAGSFAVEGVSTGVDDSGDLLRDTTVGAGRAGVDAVGNLIVGYTLRFSDVSPNEAEVRLRLRPAGGPFQAGSEGVTPTSQPNGPSELALAVNPSGTGVIAWRRGTAATAGVEACVRPAGGPCGSAQPLGSGNVISPVVAIGAGGEMVAAWRRTLGAADASFGTAAGGFGPVHDLGSATQVLVSQEGMAVDALGHALVATDHSTFPSRTVEAFVNDPVAPSIAPLSAPPGGDPGETLSFAGAVSDVWGPVTAAWDFGDGLSAPGAAATHAYAAPGAFTATLSATDAGGNTGVRSSAVAVADSVPPGVRSFGMTRRVFAVGAGSTPLSARRRAPRGTTFRFTLTEAASVRIAIERARPGRRIRGRCRKPSARLRGRPRCTRWVRQGVLRRDAAAGAGRVRFSGRLGRRALHRGRHRAVLVATDTAGNRSLPARVGFRVVRR